MVDWSRSRAPLVVVPFVAILALAFGLRIGARDDFQAAIVQAAPQGKGQSALHWQMMTIRDRQSVQETVSLPANVTAHANGKSATLSVTTNADGVAEMSLELGDLRAGDAVTLRVTDDAGQVLGEGMTTIRAPPRGPVERHWIQPSKREGRVGIDVTLRGGRLAPGHAAEAWVRLTDQTTQRVLSGATLSLTPEIGLNAAASGQSCDNGWARMELTPLAHVVGLTIDARAQHDEGTWFGALPVAPGALVVEAPTRVPEGALAFDVVAPGSQSLAYVEVDDDAGRVFAEAVPLLGNGTPRAHLKTQPLKAGRYWIVTSGEPSGAETMSGVTLAWPVQVGGEAHACDGADDSGFVPAGFPRWTAIDGRIDQEHHAAERRDRGLTLGVGSLAIAAVLETLLLLLSARRTSLELSKLALDADAPSLAPTRRRGALDIAIALLLLLLGLGLLASFATWRGGPH